MTSDFYYRRDLRGFLAMIEPMTFLLRQILVNRRNSFLYGERRAALFLLDQISSTTTEVSFDIYEHDQSLAERKHRRQIERDSRTRFAGFADKQVTFQFEPDTPDGPAFDMAWHMLGAVGYKGCCLVNYRLGTMGLGGELRSYVPSSDGIPRKLTLADWDAIIHPDDQSYVRKARRAPASQGGLRILEYRIVRPTDESVRWLHVMSFVCNDETGQPHLAKSVAFDITSLKEEQSPDYDPKL